MIQHNVEQLLEIIDGTFVKGDWNQTIEAVAFRQEKITKINTLIFIRMERGIKWDLIEKFAPCVVVTRNDYKELDDIPNCTVIKVTDVNKEYWKFVNYYRDLFDIPSIAVTGTCGKTTTKNMIRHILEFDRHVEGTHGSANSRLQDLPYLMGVDHNTDALVMETAVGRPGDLLDHCRYFKPNIGLITNIGPYHLDECGTMERYIQAKGEMLAGLGNRGILLLNKDDENIAKINLGTFNGQVVYFGKHPSAHFQAGDIHYAEKGMKFTLSFQNMEYPVYVPGFGEHQVYNAIAAIAAAHFVGVGIAESAERLQSFKIASRHLELFDGVKGSRILDDTFLSNPTSIEAALKVLKEMSLAEGRKSIALLAEIKRLGEHVESYHREIGEKVAQNEVDILITLGPYALLIGETAKEKGYGGEVYHFENLDGVEAFVNSIINERTIVLFKGYGYDLQLVNLVNRLKR